MDTEEFSEEQEEEDSIEVEDGEELIGDEMDELVGLGEYELTTGTWEGYYTGYNNGTLGERGLILYIDNVYEDGDDARFEGIAEGVGCVFSILLSMDVV